MHVCMFVCVCVRMFSSLCFAPICCEEDQVCVLMGQFVYIRYACLTRPSYIPASLTQFRPIERYQR